MMDNDKIMAMLFVTAICITALFVDAEIAKLVISQVITGIFAIVTGYRIGQSDSAKKEDAGKNREKIPTGRTDAP